jgi:hypothetical protein
MVNGAAFTEGNTDHIAFCLLGCLLDGIRHFTGLGMAMTNTTTSITNNNQGSKAEATATFHHFGNTVNGYQPFVEFWFFAFFTFTFWTSHIYIPSLEFQTTGTGCISQCFDASMIKERTTVKHYFRNLYSFCAFGNHGTDSLGCINIRAAVFTEARIKRRCCRDGYTAHIINNLNIYLVVGTMYRQTWQTCFVDTGEFCPYTASATLCICFWLTHGYIPCF